MSSPVGFGFAIVKFDHDSVMHVVNLSSFDASSHCPNIRYIVQFIFCVAAFVATDIPFLDYELSGLLIKYRRFDLPRVQKDQSK